MTDLDAMLIWLRQQVESDKARAEAAAWTSDAQTWAVSHSVKPHERPWVILDGLDDGVVIVAAESSGAEGVANHIAAHDPRDVIADCESKLAIIEECAYWYGKVNAQDPDPMPDLAGRFEVAMSVLRPMIQGYRHRDGYNPEWDQNTYWDIDGLSGKPYKRCRACKRIRDNERTQEQRGQPHDGPRPDMYGQVRESCPNGHQYSPENTYVRPDGVRKCKICRNSAYRRNHGSTARRRGHRIGLVAKGDWRCACGHLLGSSQAEARKAMQIHRNELLEGDRQGSLRHRDGYDERWTA